MRLHIADQTFEKGVGLVVSAVSALVIPVVLLDFGNDCLE